MKARKVDIKRLVRPSVRKLKAYEAREIPCRVKLDANESPYGFSLKAPRVETNRYPDPEALKLRRALARQMKVGLDSVLVGNGSDELIYYLVTTFGGPVLFPWPTFVMYGAIAQALGERAVSVPLDAGFGLDLRAMLGAVKKERPRLIFLATPNNPTGNCLDAEGMLRIVEASPGIVVIDEAYAPFASGRGMAPLLADYPNMVIMRTLSKVGLAALRVGYMAGSEEIISEVNKVRLPFNLNSYSQALAVEALKDRGAMKGYIRDIASERERLMKALGEMDGIEPCPSEANFILFRAGAGAKKVYDGLLRRGVLIRNMDGLIKGCLRVTVGTRRENSAFIKALKETLK